MTYLEACYAQGMRCGYLDGKERVGSYVQDEEMLVDVADQGRDEKAELAFKGGYQIGYRIGACGAALDAEVVNAPLPEECMP